MFGIFKKNEAEESSPLSGILSMAKPLLKMKGIDLETMIPNAAAGMKSTQDRTGIQIAAIIAVNDAGTGFDLGFYTPTDDGMQQLHSIEILSIDQSITAFTGLAEIFKHLIPTENVSSQLQINTAAEPATLTTIDEPADTASVTELGANASAGTIDPLDQSDAE